MAEMPPNSNSRETKIDGVADASSAVADHRFSLDQMIGCDSCTRTNPPTRTSCLYCGEPLQLNALTGEFAKINYQRPEPWEDGFSLVYAGTEKIDQNSLSAAADLLNIEPQMLEQSMEVHVPLPLIYLRSLTDAGLLASRLSNIGFDCAIVGDDLLQARVLPTRVRSISISDDEFFFEDFNTSKMIPVNREDRVLLVSGLMVKTSTETSGKISKRSLSTTDESLTSFDELVIDIYPPNDVYGL